MLRMVMARSSSDGSAICYVLPVLWMKSCFHIMDRIGQNQRGRYVFSSSPGGCTESEAYRLRLHLVWCSQGGIKTGCLPGRKRNLIHLLSSLEHSKRPHKSIRIPALTPQHEMSEVNDTNVDCCSLMMINDQSVGPQSCLISSLLTSDRSASRQKFTNGGVPCKNGRNRAQRSLLQHSHKKGNRLRRVCHRSCSLPAVNPHNLCLRMPAEYGRIFPMHFCSAH